MIGVVVVNQIPMLMTFKESEAEFVCTVLEDAIKKSYQFYDMFVERGEDPWEDEE